MSYIKYLKINLFLLPEKKYYRRNKLIIKNKLKLKNDILSRNLKNLRENIKMWH